MTAPLDLAGKTSLLRLTELAGGLAPAFEGFGKAAGANLGGSVKDCPTLWVSRDGERRGLPRPGVRVAAAASGSTGIACAMIGAAPGYEVTLVTILCDSANYFCSGRF